MQNFLILMLLILSGIGSFIFAPLIGGIFAFLGVAAGIISHYSTIEKNRYLESIIFEQSRILSKVGLGNPFVEMVKKEILRTGISSKIIKILIQEIESNPANIQALGIFC